VKEQRLSGDVPAPMLTVEQQQALERVQEIRELLPEIDVQVDHACCVALLDALERQIVGRSEQAARINWPPG